MANLNAEERKKVEKFKARLEEIAGMELPKGYCGCVDEDGEAMLLITSDVDIEEADKFTKAIAESDAFWEVTAGCREDCAGNYTKF